MFNHRDIATHLNRTILSIGSQASRMRLRRPVTVSIGDIYDRLEVIDEELASDGYRNWRCRCECGGVVIVRSASLISHNTRSCGCGPAKNRKRMTGVISRTLFGCIQRAAKVRNLLFNITPEYLNDIFVRQNGRCALSGLQLDILGTRRNKHTQYTASLDRIDSSVGYIEGNVQWVHKDINMMKQSFSQESFIQLCCRVAQEYKQGTGNYTIALDYLEVENQLSATGGSAADL